jgi:hypothetical protein
MNTDELRRLAGLLKAAGDRQSGMAHIADQVVQAADEIDSLRAENEHLSGGS